MGNNIVLLLYASFTWLLWPPVQQMMCFQYNSLDYFVYFFSFLYWIITALLNNPHSCYTQLYVNSWIKKKKIISITNSTCFSLFEIKIKQFVCWNIFRLVRKLHNYVNPGYLKKFMAKHKTSDTLLGQCSYLSS